MITTRRRVEVTIEQMGRVFGAVEGSMDEILPNNPKLFALLVEGYLEEFDRMRQELAHDLRELRKARLASAETLGDRAKPRGRKRQRVG
jgi:hypothetical protein